MSNKQLHMLAFLLVIVGGINWGLVGALDLNLVTLLFGSVMWLEKVVYILVGVSAVWLLLTHQKDCKVCGTGGGSKGKK